MSEKEKRAVELQEILASLNKEDEVAAKEEEETPEKPGKRIKETKCTCAACGNIWYYGKKEMWEQASNALSNAGKELACCTGCLPAVFIKDKKSLDLNKCPKCGSKAIKKEEVIHVVQ